MYCIIIKKKKNFITIIIFIYTFDENSLKRRNFKNFINNKNIFMLFVFAVKCNFDKLEVTVERRA